MIRTGLWFAKWGTILGAVMAGAGWMAGNGGGGAGVGQAGGGAGGGMMSFVGGLVLDAINGRDQNAAGGSRSRNTRSRPNTNSQTPPRAWDSWQYQEKPSTRGKGKNSNNNRNDHDQGQDGRDMVQGIIGSIIGAADRGGWLDAARSAMDGFRNAGADAEASTEESNARTRKQPTRKTKTKAKAGSR